MNELEGYDVVSDGLRFDRWVADNIARFPTRAGARKAIKRGEILLDGQQARSGDFVHVGQRISVVDPPGNLGPIYPRSLEVVYEDADVAVVIKPPGLRVNGAQYRTAERALRGVLQPGLLRQPRVAHRLDAPTGGLLAVGKSPVGLVGLNRAFAAREVHKEYRALAVGKLDRDVVVDEPVDDRSARTRFVVLGTTRALKSDWITEVRAFPETGRRHQIRRHLAGLGHPILGDASYGIDGLVLRGKGLFLWAVGLAFPHPISGTRVALAIEPPAKFASLVEREARRWRKYNP